MKTCHPFPSFICVPLLLLSAFIMAGCTDRSEEPSGVSDRHSTLRFSLSVTPFGNGENDTRSEGNDFERSIDTEDMVVLLFGEDDTKRGVFSGDEIKTDGDSFMIPDVNLTAGVVSKIVVLANFDSEEDYEEVESLSDLRALNLPYKADMNRLPMSGMADCRLSGDIVEVRDIEMVRSVAKIEIADRLDNYTITSATLSSYSNVIHPLQSSAEGNGATAANLSFLHDEENNLYYAYVPETVLGEPDSPERKIEMKVMAQGGAEEETYTLWLKDYTSDEEGNTSTYSWEKLERNFLYRFNVTTLEEPTPPTPEIQDKIEIRWYPTVNGKFSTAYYNYLSYSTGVTLLLKDNNAATIKQYAAEITPTPHYQKTDFIEFSVDINLKTLGWNIENLSYEIIDKNFKGQTTSGYSEKWEENIPGNLLEDASRFEIMQEDGKTILRLNTLPLQYTTSPTRLTTFPSDMPIRLYWRNPLISSIGNIYYNQSSQTISSKSKILTDGSYSYVEFKVPQNCTILLPNWKGLVDGYTEELYSLWPDHHAGTLLYTYDFIPMNIDGKDCLVFFVD